MSEEEILNEIIKDIIRKIESHRGISEFIKNISKFEGWLKVEIVDSAIKLGCTEVIPEKERIDITFKHKSLSYAIELKTINTNYQQDYTRKIRPITKNIDGIIKDIHDLRKNNDYDSKYVLFIVFPLDLESNKNLWENHLNKITNLTQLQSFRLNFLENHKGMLYLGEVK
ncbi:MAG: hypothetical protein KKA64_03790 [Nanoarchaeota archaeon]|nr:hypothetical protein [Nanoarchaeota archaeon]